MRSRLFLVLALVFLALRVHESTGALLTVGYGGWSLIFSVLAVASARPALDRDGASRLADGFGQWLDAWNALYSGTDRDRVGAEQALASASHMIALLADDRVVRSLKATRLAASPSATAELVLAMRRNLRRASTSLRPAEIEALLAWRPTTMNGRGSAPSVANPASFLS